MGILYTKKFDDVGELFEYINGTFTVFKNHIFRGHSNDKWKLESTLTRALQRVYPDIVDYSEIVTSHYGNFLANVRGRTSLDLKNVDEDELWALGQHNGMYTPLLDWTESPYVGLFFTMQQETSSAYRALWAISRILISYINKKSLCEEDLKIIKPLTHDKPRLVNQTGLFIKIPPHKNIQKLK